MNTNKAILTTSAVAVVVGAGWWTLSHRNSADDTIYKTAVVEQRDLRQTVSATGIVQPFATVDIKSRAGGEVKTLAVDVGSIVKPGDLIARIDPTDSQTTYTQAAADVSAARARVSQTQQTLALQKATTVTSIAEAQAQVQAARTRLASARATAQAQPLLTEAAVRQARAALQTAKQNLSQLQTGTDPQARADARGTLAQAQANLTNAQLNLKRQQQLLAKGFVAQQAVDTAQANVDVIQAQVEAAKTRADTVGGSQEAQIAAARSRVNESQEALRTAEANRVQINLRRQDVASAEAALAQAQAAFQTAQANRAQVGIRAADIATAQSQIARSEASLQNAKIVLDLTTIRAPRGGVILQKYVEQGTIITSGQSFNSSGTSLVQIGDLSRVFVEAAIDESDIGQVKPGQKVKVTLDALSDQEFEGRVRRTDPRGTTDQNITTVKTQIELVHPSQVLRPGLNAECEFLVREKKNVLVIPSRAVRNEKGKKTVQVMTDPEGKKAPEARTITTGMETSDSVEVTEGLKAGEKVVIATIKPGDDSKGGGGKGGAGKGAPGGGAAKGPGGLGGGGGRF